jgi:acetolactate synthase I/III small subunit
MKHTITALVENQPGVLSRVVGLISGRGYNIESLNVGPTQDPAVSRMTIRVPGDDRVLEQVTKQLNKLVDVIKVTDLTKQSFVSRELVLVKVSLPRARRAEIVELAKLFGCEVASVGTKTLIIQLVDGDERIAEFLELVKPYGIVDVSRSGMTAMAKD